MFSKKQQQQQNILLPEMLLTSRGLGKAVAVAKFYKFQCRRCTEGNGVTKSHPHPILPPALFGSAPLSVSAFLLRGL